MSPRLPEFHLKLPDWVERFMQQHPVTGASAEARMDWVLKLTQHNVECGGGPFGAAVFCGGQQDVFIPGINLVTHANCSVAHAEIVAIILAQQALGRFDLSNSGRESYTLVSSTEPCAMCMGAVPWSGIRHLVCGARDEDARAIGFDEGAKPTDWPGALQQRGIHVQRDVRRNEAAEILRQYAAAGHPIYNSGAPGHEHGTIST